MYQTPFMQYQQPVTMGIAGKVINRPEEITINDVPMDGNIAVFPKNDLSEVLIKKWNANGSILTLKFTPFIEGVDNSTLKANDAQIGPQLANNSEVLETMRDALFRIEKMLGGKNAKKSGNDTTAVNE